MPDLEAHECERDTDRCRKAEVQPAVRIVPPERRPLTDAHAPLCGQSQDLGVEQDAGLFGLGEELAAQRAAVDLETALRVGHAADHEQLRKQGVQLSHELAGWRVPPFQTRAG